MRQLIFSCLAVMLLCGCERVVDEGSPGAPVVLRFAKDYVVAKTKSSIFPLDVETVESGATVAFYNAETGRLDLQHRVGDLSSPANIVLREGKMNIYVLGNVWLIDEDGNPQAPDFPADEKDVETFCYQFGNVPSGKGLRTESYEEIATYGIPVRGVLKGVNIHSGAVLDIGLKRMFAKVSITVDHGGISSGDGQFKNEQLYFRQANALQTPFASDGSRAAVAEQLIDRSDYESPMQDGEKNCYTFYLPENRQTSPATELATYVEFSAEVDKSAGGYGGGVTYRFYLGKNSGIDNDLEGNVWYDILLSFKASSLFEPSWRVDLDEDFSDDRMFCVMKDKACTDVLGEQKVVVRAGRPGNVYVYMNRDGEKGANHLVGKRMDGDFVASSLEDCAWTGDFSNLEERGISASWEASEGKLTLSVNDASLFVPGENMPVTLQLMPGNKKVVMNVSTAEDQMLKYDSSELYMGMKRNFTMCGFAGSGHMVRTESDVQGEIFRSSVSSLASFIGKGGTSFVGDSVDLYAWGCDEDDPVTLIFESDDSFNDDPVPVTFAVRKPVFRKEQKELHLLLDGTGSKIEYGFSDIQGKTFVESDFVTELYEKLLAPSVDWSDSSADTYASYSSGEFFIDYFGQADQENWIGKQGESFGEVFLKPRSSLYAERSAYSLSVKFPRYERDFPQTLRTNYLNEYFDSKIDLSADFNTYGNAVSFTAESLSGSIQYDLAVTDKGGGVRMVELQMDENVNLAEIPGSVNVFWGSLANPRVKSGDKEIVWRTPVAIYHELTIAPFGVFEEGYTEMTVYLTYPKAAWMLKKYYENEISDYPEWETAGEMDAYQRYIWWKRLYTTGLNIQRYTSSSTNIVDISYCDLFPSDFPDDKEFTRAIAESASEIQWLTDVRFKINGSVMDEPLHSAYLDGNAFYSIKTSRTPIAWIYVPE